MYPSKKLDPENGGYQTINPKRLTDMTNKFYLPLKQYFETLPEFGSGVDMTLENAIEHLKWMFKDQKGLGCLVTKWDLNNPYNNQTTTCYQCFFSIDISHDSKKTELKYLEGRLILSQNAPIRFLMPNYQPFTNIITYGHGPRLNINYMYGMPECELHGTFKRHLEPFFEHPAVDAQGYEIIVFYMLVYSDSKTGVSFRDPEQNLLWLETEKNAMRFMIKKPIEPSQTSKKRPRDEDELDYADLNSEDHKKSKTCVIQ